MRPDSPAVTLAYAMAAARLTERVRVLESALRWVRDHGSTHNMPDEVLAVLITLPP